MQIKIQTLDESVNGFSIQLDNKLPQTKPSAYKIDKVGSDVNFSLRIENVYRADDVLAQGFKLEDIEVDGTTYNTFEGLSEALTPILFKKGGGSGGGGTGDLTLEQARQNGNVLEGDVELATHDAGQILIKTQEGQSGQGELKFIDGGQIEIAVKDEVTNNQFSILFNPNGAVIASSDSESKGLVGQEEFNKQGDRKAFAQLFDLQDGYIPLTGTEEGKPVTGDIEIDELHVIKSTSLTDLSRKIYFTDEQSLRFEVENSQGFTYIAVSSNGTEIQTNDKNTGYYASFQQNTLGLGLQTSNPEARGIEANEYYGANYTDNTYVQKKYVDDSNSYSTEETKTGGTWIDGKPIYRKVVPYLLVANYQGSFYLEHNLNIEQYLKIKFTTQNYSGKSKIFDLTDVITSNESEQASTPFTVLDPSYDMEDNLISVGEILNGSGYNINFNIILEYTKQD